MVSLSTTALVALALSPAPAGAETPPDLDRRCYRLMAQLAEEEDPHVRSAALVGAQYFLGRIDGDGRGLAHDGAADAPARGAELLRRCADRMGAGGRDFRNLGEALARRDSAV